MLFFGRTFFGRTVFGRTRGQGEDPGKAGSQQQSGIRSLKQTGHGATRQGQGVGQGKARV